MDEGTGDGDALLLPAGELGGALAAARSSASRRGRPLSSNGTETFSTRSSVGMRLNCWKMKPM
jgi:hypothetical protein